MAKMKPGVRSPTAHRTKEQASRQWQDRMKRDEKGERRKNRMWKEARRKVCKGNEAKCKGKDVDHKRPLSKGGTNARSNLRLRSPSKNRGHGMSPGGTKKGTRARG